MTLNKKMLGRVKDVLVVLLVPVLFTLLFGYVYSNIYVEEIPVAILDLDHSENSHMVRDNFDHSSGIRITDTADSQDQLQDLILSGQVKGGVVIPPDFGKDLQEKKGPGLLVLIDGSNLVIGNNLYAYTSTVVTTLNIGIQANLLEGGSLVPYTAEQYLGTLSFTDRMLYDPQLGYFQYVFAGVLGILIQQTYVGGLIPAFMDAKKTREPLLGHGVRIAAVSLCSFLCCLLIAHKLYSYPLRGGLAELLVLGAGFLLAMTAVAFILTAFFDDTAHCVQFSMFLSIPTFLTSGYVWPEFMMAPGFGPVIKAIWPLYYFSNPLRDVCMKGAGFGEIGHYIAGVLIFAAVWLPISMLLYRKKAKKLERRSAPPATPLTTTSFAFADSGANTQTVSTGIAAGAPDSVFTEAVQ